MNDLLWAPSSTRKERANLGQFIKSINNKFQLNLQDYQQLHTFSTSQISDFWSYLFEYFHLKYEGNLSPAFKNLDFKEYTWFENVKLNFAENLLSQGKEDSIALNFIHESGLQKKLSYKQLTNEVGSFQKYLSTLISSGDVVGAYMPNLPETVITMLATSGLGGVFTSTSCDFGIEGVYDRFSQSKPKVIVAAIGYEYSGKYFDQTDKILELEKRLTNVERIIIVDFLKRGVDLSRFKNAVLYSDVLAQNSSNQIIYKREKFSHPLYIMYSSGTTGKPKCIVHSQGGTLLQHVKELSLHSDLTAQKRIFFFTTCGWMMWNWLVSSLCLGSEVILYDGSPAHPSPEYFFKMIEREKIHIFGTSPKFLKALEDTNAQVDMNHTELETILSTGSPLLPEQFDYVYKNIKSDLLLASISGGTDIIGCFMLGNPLMGVYRGEIQCRGLGMDVASVDENRKELIEKEGELVCRKSFPSRPIYFLNDPNNEKLNEAYFNQYPGFWTHGDFVKVTKRGGVIVYGRSDATLNPGGVRIGTAEIYRQTESLQYILDSLCVGKPNNGDVDVILFVKMKDNEVLTTERKKEIKDLIKKNTTPRHVPREIYSVGDIPYTRSGKKVELAVTRIISNREVTNVEAIANAECLMEYKKFAVN